MRTSLSQQVQSSLMYLNLSSNGLTEAQSHAASGKRILRPSDDVPGTNKAMSLRSAISTMDQYTNNMTVNKPLLLSTENAIGSLVKSVQSVRTIALASANPANNQTALKAYADQLDDIMAQMADTANTKHLDQYIFSGTATDTSTLQAQAGAQPFAYMGNSGERKIQVLSWVNLPVNIPGDKLFNFDQGAGAGTTDLFTMVKQLKDVVLTGNVDNIGKELGNIDANLDNILSYQARVGSWISRTENSLDVLSASSDRLSQMLSDTEDVDLPKAIIDLKTQENVYQAALAISSRMLDMSLASMQNFS